jgi:hypothetical protein
LGSCKDPTFNLIGRPRGPRMKCGWGAARPAYRTHYARALHYMSEAADGL